MAYTLGNKCAKNLCKRIVLLHLIIENVVTFFWNTVYKWRVSSRAANSMALTFDHTQSQNNGDAVRCRNIVGL